MPSPSSLAVPVASRQRKNDLKQQMATAYAQARQRDEAFAWEWEQVNAVIGRGVLITLPVAIRGGPFYLGAVCIKTHTYQCATVPGGIPTHFFALYNDHLWRAVLSQANVARHPFFGQQARRWQANS